MGLAGDSEHTTSEKREETDEKDGEVGRAEAICMSLYSVSYNEALLCPHDSSLPPNLVGPPQSVNLFNDIEEQPSFYGSPVAGSSHSDNVGSSEADNAKKSRMRKADIVCNFCRSKSSAMNI
jgi:hypothetical protein